MTTTTTTGGNKRTTTVAIPSLEPTETELHVLHFANKKELAYMLHIAIASQVAVDQIEVHYYTLIER